MSGIKKSGGRENEDHDNSSNDPPLRFAERRAGLPPAPRMRTHGAALDPPPATIQLGRVRK